MSLWIAAVTAQFALAQDALHLRDDVRGDAQVLPAPVLLESTAFRRSRSPSGLCMSGSLDLDIAELDGRSCAR